MAGITAFLMINPVYSCHFFYDLSKIHTSRTFFARIFRYFQKKTLTLQHNYKHGHTVSTSNKQGENKTSILEFADFAKVLSGLWAMFNIRFYLSSPTLEGKNYIYPLQNSLRVLVPSFPNIPLHSLTFPYIPLHSLTFPYIACYNFTTPTPNIL